MEPDKIKKTSSSSSTTSCPSSWLNDLKNVPHRKADIAKLYKKVEKVSRRLLHNDSKHHNTFVASSIQPNEQGTSGAPLPYPVDSQFGSGFPPLPSSSSQNNHPPSYGWALHSDNIGPPAQAPYGALNLEIGVGDETSGSGFDYLTDQNMHGNEDYLRPNFENLEVKRNEQITALRHLQERADADLDYLNILMNDDSNLIAYMNELFGDSSLLENEVIKDEIASLTAILQHCRKQNPERTPPPRPPPPRSGSQDLTTSSWKCVKCDSENQNNQYRCRVCCLPSRRIDPVESNNCKCRNCS